MKSATFIVLTLILSFSFLSSHNSVAVTDDALSIITNPAGLGFQRTFEGFIVNPFDSSGFYNETSLFLRAGNIGFGSQFFGEENDYNAFTFSLGSKMGKSFFFGSSYRWFTKIDRSSEWDIGLLYRPNNLLSVGITGKNITSPGNDVYPEYIFGLGVRPFGNRFTLSLDASLNKTANLNYGDELNLTGGAQFEILDGFVLKGHFSDNSFGAGLGVNLSNLGVEGYGNFDDDNDFSNGYVVTRFSADRYRTVLKGKDEYFVSMNLKGPIIEERRHFGIFSKKFPTVKEILDIIEDLTDDPEVKGLYIVIGGPQCGFSKKQEIRKALERFKGRGKKIICYSEGMGNTDYYLASVADSIFMPPSGYLTLMGLYVDIPFIKGTLDKIGIEPELERIGEYKSAADIVSEDSMSEAFREAESAILDDLYEQLTSTISEAREIGRTQLNKIIDSASFMTADAKENGLIDGLLYEDEIMDWFKESKIKVVSIGKYVGERDYVYDWYPEPKDKIAIIYATGSIVSGKNGSDLFAGDLMGSETIVKAIKDARKDKDTKAIIFRIDSGGGSGLASDMIWREVKKSSEGDKTKPFIVSMSGVAGSGGYYIACAGDVILAEESTITGSIGVISGKFNLKKLYDKIGLKFETIERGKHAAMLTSTKPFTDEEREIIKKETEEFYYDFISKVAEGRGLTVEEVDEVGRGRIWTGNQAKEIGLIDEIGGLREAIKLAKQQAGIPEKKEVSIDIYPKYSRGFLGLGNSGGPLSMNNLIPEELIKVLSDMGQYRIYENEKILYIMPYTIEIE